MGTVKLMINLLKNFRAELLWKRRKKEGIRELQSALGSSMGYRKTSMRLWGILKLIVDRLKSFVAELLWENGKIGKLEKLECKEKLGNSEKMENGEKWEKQGKWENRKNIGK